ncbi:hypothetical protein F5Y18DRAFT_400660 [Xylariaceae sp. FL1019]|nr:hypothetical protein F5Y18DRAFT_400660 [Xylariaceae sp. FL1019]
MGQIQKAQADCMHILTNLKRQLNKTLELGEPGYLAQHYQSNDLRPMDYERRLTRAAWHYIALLGSPDDGVAEDGEAWETTRKLFRDLPKDHLLRAIEHVHIQAYHRPFVKESAR